MWKSLKHNFMLKVFSLLISLTLWLHVQLSRPQVAQELFNFEVKVVNLDRSRLALTRLSADVVRIRATGPSEELKKVKGKTFAAYIDLIDAEPGLKEYRLQADYPSGVTVEWERPPTVFANVEVLAHDFKKVTVIQDDSMAPSGFTLGEPSVEPEMVKIEGPQSRITNVVTVRAMLTDVRKVRPGMRFNVPLELLDKDNKIVIGVTADRMEVTVIPALLPMMQRHNLLVTPDWKGQPAFGYRVASVLMAPNQVELIGDDKKLSRLSTITTLPIDLTGLTESQTFEVGLALPPGSQIKGRRTVTIRVRIEKLPEPPAPSSGPQNP